MQANPVTTVQATIHTLDDFSSLSCMVCQSKLTCFCQTAI
jgi:hypothetical protein